MLVLRMSRPFHVTMAAIVLATVALSSWGMAATGIRVSAEQLWPKLGLYFSILAGAAFAYWRGAPRFANAFLIIFWMALVSDLHIFPMFLAGRQSLPFSDDLLAACDRALGLEVPDVLAWLADHPLVRELLEGMYSSLVYLMATALLATTLGNRLRTAQMYVIANVVAVLICFPFFAFFQAIGPWVVYGYSPSPHQQLYMQVFAALKEQKTFTIDLGYVNGLLCFPSFHTVLAVLAAWALRSLPVLRWLALAWSGLIVVSTVTTGWHYVVDVIAGFGVAGLSVLGAKAFASVESLFSNGRQNRQIPTCAAQPAAVIL